MPPGKTNAEGSVQGGTALVAESDRAMRELLRLHLQNFGFNVVLAPDALVAGRTLLEGSPRIDLLIVDAQLPYMSGIDFVSALIADSSLPFIPTIIIAPNDELARRADALDVPILVAPFSAEDLLAVVASDKPTGCLRRSPALTTSCRNLVTPTTSWRC
jgi:DNA-binding response OmpR family regulator